MTSVDEASVVLSIVWGIVVVAACAFAFGVVVCLYADGWRSGLNLTNRPKRGTMTDTTNRW